MATLHVDQGDDCTYYYDFAVTLGPDEDQTRAERILRAAVLQINDKVLPLYHGQDAPERVSALEAGNYAKGRR